MNDIVHKPKKLLMASKYSVLTDYVARRQLDREYYELITDPQWLRTCKRGQDITLVLTECDWQAERSLRDMAISRAMVITETYG